jgi:predicted nucleotidyltransferase
MTADASEALPGALRNEMVDALRTAGARFALLHGSRAEGTHGPSSDVDVAAWWGADGNAPQSFEVLLPSGVDLLVLDHAPLELAGRVALGGVLLFDDDPPARVRWVATTRKIYADELPRLSRSHREFVESIRRGR